MRKIFTKALTEIISISMLMQGIAALPALAENEGEISLFSVAEQAGNDTIKAKGKALQRGTETAGITTFDKTTMPEAAAGCTTYYIDPAGDDTKDGTTEATAWKSAERINTVELNAGDRILFKAGGTWTAPNAANTYIADFDDDGDDRYDYWIIPRGDGTKEKPIVIGAYGTGALPKLIGASKTNSVLSVKDNEYWDISNLDISNFDETFDYSKPNDANNAKKMGDLRGIDIFGQSFEADADGNRIIRGFNLHDLYIHDITGYVYWGGAPAERGYPGVYGNMGQDASKRTGGIVFEVWKPTTETYLGFTEAQKTEYDSLNTQLASYTGKAGDYVSALNMKQAAEDRNSYGDTEKAKYEAAKTALAAESSELVGTIDTAFTSLQSLIAARKAVQDANTNDQPITFDDVTIANNVIYDTSFGGITVKQWEGDGHKEVAVDPFYIAPVQKTYENWGRREGADAYWDNTTKTLTQEDTGWHPHTNIVIKNNYVSQEGMEQGCNTIRIASVKGALIEHNVCAGSGTCAIELDYIDDSVTQYNEIYGTYKKMGGADNNAIDTDYRTTNCLVQYNYVYNNGDSFLLCGKAFSTAVYRYNIAANTSAGNSRADDHFVSVDGDKGYNYIYNNLFYNNLEVANIHYIVQNTSELSQTSTAINKNNPLYIYNNIFYNEYSSTNVVNIQNDSRTDDVFYYDNNSYYGSGVTPPEKDANAVTDKPYFADGQVPFGASTSTTAVDLAPFALTDKSPLINSGKTVELPPSFKGTYVDQYKALNDMYGNSVSSTPDIGVNEYQLAADKGIICGHVTDDYSNALDGVTVTAVAGITAETDENGYYSIGEIDAGSYILKAEKEDYTAITKTEATAVTSGAVSVVDFENMESTLTTGTVTGVITCAGVAAEGVTVTADTGETATTDANGAYSLTVEAGNRTLTVSGNDYKTQTRENVTVQKNITKADENFGIQSSANEEHTYGVRDNFNDYEAGAFASDIWTVDGTGEATVIAGEGTNKYIKLNKTNRSTNYGMWNKESANLGGIVTIGARVMRTSVSSMFGMWSFNKSSTNQTMDKPGDAVTTFNMDSGKFRTHYKTDVGSNALADFGTYDKNEWHDVYVVANLNTKTYDMYLDNTDAPVLINQKLRNQNGVTSIDKLLFYSNASATGDMCVDWIYACTGVQLDETKVPYMSYTTGSGTINGTVTHNGAAVENAAVTLKKDGEAVNGASATTASDGTYTLNEAPSGKDYTLEVTAENCKTTSKTGINIYNGSTQTIDFAVKGTRLEPETSEYTINDDFNSYDTGIWANASSGSDTANLHGTDAQWRVYNTDGTNTTVEIAEENDNNKYLRISRTASATNVAGVFNQSEKNLTGLITIETRIKRTNGLSGQWNSFNMYFYGSGFTYDNPKGSEVKTSIVARNNKLYTHSASNDSTEVESISQDKWYDIRIVADTNTGKYDMYVDDMDTPVLVNQELKNSSSAFKRFFFYSGNSKLAGDLCIDYFRVYQGEPYDHDDATLKSVTVNGTEAEENNGEYTASASYVSPKVTILPVAHATKATVTIDGKEIPESGLELDFTGNTLEKTIVVTAEDGETTVEYPITITRAAAEYGTISGTVTDKDGSGVEGVTVTAKIYNITKTATTGTNGEYTISEAPAASGYTVTASKDGYRDKTKSGVNVSKDNTTTADVTLKAVGDKPVYAINESFNGYTTEVWKSGSGTTSVYGEYQWKPYQSDETNNIVEIVDDEQTSGNKYLHIKRSTTGSKAFGIFNNAVTNVEGTVTIEAKVKTSNTTTDMFGMYSYNTGGSFSYENPVGSEVSATFYMTNGNLNTHTSSATATASTYTSEVWKDIKIVANTNTAKFDFYVDDMNTPVLKDQALKNSSTSLARFLLFSNKTAKGEMYVDYLRVTADEPYDRDDVNLDGIKVNNTSATKDGDDYTITLDDAETTSVTILPETYSIFASATIDGEVISDSGYELTLTDASTSKEIVVTSEDGTTTKTYTVTVISPSYTVTWKNGENTIETDENVAYGATPEYNGTVPTKDADAQYTYIFDGWTIDGGDGTVYSTTESGDIAAFGTVTDNITYVAHFTETAREYNITYNINGHGTAPTGEYLKYKAGTGKDLPALTDDNYDFGGWYTDNETFNNAAAITSETRGDKTFYAKWTAKTYSVTAATGLTHGAVAVNKSTASLGDEITVTISPETGYQLATLTVGGYAVTGTALTSAISGNSYTFNMPAKAVEVTATFEEIPVTTYTVTIIGGEGIENVKLGTKTGSKDGNIYTFTEVEAGEYNFEVTYTEGYEKATVSPTSITVSESKTSETISAQKKKYTVTFKIEGRDDTEVQIEHGSTAQSQAPQNPTKSGYHFVGWVKGTDTTAAIITTWDAITSNGTIYTAKFEENAPDTVTVTFNAGDGTFDNAEKTKAVTINKGATLTANNLPSVTPPTGYTFNGWGDITGKAVNESVSYTAEYTIKSFTITWMLDESAKIDETTVDYNVLPTHADASKAATDEYTYTFKGWTPAIVAATENATYTAQFDSVKRKYTITWNIDGAETSEELEYGATPSHPNPTKMEDANGKYSFTGWLPAIETVSKAQNYTAQFDLISKFTITYNTYDGTINDSNYATVYYAGEGATLPTDVTKNGYTFAGWYDNDKFEGEAVTTISTAETCNKTYYANWTLNAPNEYLITFVNWDNTELQKSNVAVGTKPEYTGTTPTKADDSRYTYEFIGWTPEIILVSGIATYKAEFKQYVKPIDNSIKIEKVIDNGVKLVVTPTSGMTTINLYVAIYNADGSLKSVGMTSCTVSDNGKIIVPLTEPSLAGGESYKLMLWDIYQSPLITAITNSDSFFN